MVCIRYGLCILDTACVYKKRLVFRKYGLCEMKRTSKVKNQAQLLQTLRSASLNAKNDKRNGDKPYLMFESVKQESTEA